MSNLEWLTLTASDYHGSEQSALDRLYRYIDERLCAGEFAIVNRHLKEVNIEFCCSTTFIIGILTATLPAKDKLSNRPEFFRRCERELTRRCVKEPYLLEGLQ